MKGLRTILFMIACVVCSFMFSQTITSTSPEIAEHFDLQTAVNLFGNSKSVEDFEYNLNDPSLAISNLDFNGDGEVDYLRCVEYNEGSAHYVAIQACLGANIYQDIAIIYINKSNETITVQIVGNQHIYGINYVIEPVYIYHPVIYDWFLSRTYVIWHSPYCWGYYPYHWHSHQCVHVTMYHRHICNYNRTHYCSYHRSSTYHEHYHFQNNPYYVAHPEHSQCRRQINTRQTQPVRTSSQTRQTQLVRTTSQTRQTQLVRTSSQTRQTQPVRTSSQPRQTQPVRTSSQPRQTQHVSPASRSVGHNNTVRGGRR